MQKIFSGRKVWAAFVKPKAERWKPKEESHKKQKNYDFIFYYHLPAIALSPIQGANGYGQ